MHKLDNAERIFKEFKIAKYLNASIDFGQIQYQSSLIDIIYLCAVLGPSVKKNGPSVKKIKHWKMSSKSVMALLKKK